MKLTKTDQAILESCCSLVDALGEYLGSAYELSLHSFEDYDHSVIRIINGYHSGRTVGAPLTDLAINMLKRINDQGLSARESYTSYNAVSSLGEHLKSSTIPIMGENGRLIGMLCINLYLDSPFSEIIHSFTGNGTGPTRSEHYVNNMADTISQAVADAKSQVMPNSAIPAVNKNKELIRILYEKGIFNIKDSVLQVAGALGISRNTVYMHLRSIARSAGE